MNVVTIEDLHVNNQMVMLIFIKIIDSLVFIEMFLYLMLSDVQFVYFSINK